MFVLDNPCRWCKYRHVSCHSSCFLYKEWKSQNDILREKEREWIESNGIKLKQLRCLNPPDKRYHKR